MNLSDAAVEESVERNSHVPQGIVERSGTPVPTYKGLSEAAIAAAVPPATGIADLMIGVGMRKGVLTGCQVFVSTPMAALREVTVVAHRNHRTHPFVPPVVPACTTRLIPSTR